MEIYQVGGSVRDELLGHAASDRDWVVVGGSAEALLEQGYRRVGRDFPVFLHPQTHEEYALARTERKSGRGYSGFETTSSADVTLEQDLARRDFTINAMARAAGGDLVDPYGGRADLAARTLRHVSDAFVEDPLRVLRAARFAARFDFRIAPETLALMTRMSGSGELHELPGERVWQELRRALVTAHPGRFVTVLRACGALGELFPELERLFGVPQPARYHPEIDTGEHLLLVLEQAARRDTPEIVRFAALVHDLGKGTTPADILPSHRGHEERGVALIGDFCDRVSVPKTHRELAQMTSLLHTRVHRALDMRPVRLLALLEQADAFRRPERFRQFLETCICDATGRAGLQDSDYPQAARLAAALAATQSVDTAAVAAAVAAGPARAEAVRQARLDALTRSGI